MALITTGGVYPGSSKYFGELFTEVLAEGTAVLPRALEIAREMAENVSPLASYMSRALMWQGPTSPEGAHLLESKVFHHMAGQRFVRFALLSIRANKVLRLVITKRESTHSWRSERPISCVIHMK